MKRTGRQSNNLIDIRDPKANANYQGVVRQELKARNSERLASDDSIAYNQDKTPGDRVVGALKNPGRTKSTGMNKVVKDPAPEKLDVVSRSNYDEVPFFKHKEVPNVYKEEK